MEGSKRKHEANNLKAPLRFQSNLNNGRLKKLFSDGDFWITVPEFQSNLNNGRLKKLKNRKTVGGWFTFQSNLNNGRLKKSTFKTHIMMFGKGFNPT